MMTLTRTLTLSALIAAVPMLGFAQTMPAPMMAKTEKHILTLAGARAVVAAAEAEARRLNTTGAIAVVDDGGSLLYLLRLDNTFPAGAAVATDKARTAAASR